jgi:pimeloyl-ACP methyl ester carboxylesterase
MSSQAPVYKIAAPVLALAGGRDRVNPASTVRRVVARFPEGQAHYHEFPEMSHWLVGEPEAGQVAELTAQWLEARGFSARPKRVGKRTLFQWRDSAGA